jgi:hypothetical protein
MPVQITASEKDLRDLRPDLRSSFFTGCPLRLARPRTPPFHGENRGSNPLGDAKLI